MAKTKKKTKSAKAKAKKAPARAKSKLASKAASKKVAVKKAPLKALKKMPVKKALVKKAASKKVPVKKAAKPAAKATAKSAAKKFVQKALTRVGGLPDELYEAAIKILNDRQAEEIVTFSLAGRSSMADYLIIASGRASRQIAAIADYLREAFMKLGVRQVRIEGQQEANWVLVDAGDVIIHLFRPEVRRYYRLEDIWTEDPKTPAKAAFTNE